MHVRPMNDRLLVRKLGAAEKIGSILVPDAHDEDMIKCEIVSISRGKVTDSGKIIPIDAKIGSTIIIDKCSTIELKVDNETLFLIKEDAILVVLDEGHEIPKEKKND